MKKIYLFLLLVGMVGFGFCSFASASTFTYNLDYRISDPDTPLNNTIGTVTIADNTNNANYVDVTIALNDNDWKILSFDLNFLNNSTKVSYSGWDITNITNHGGSKDLTYDFNKIRPPGYGNQGGFDLGSANVNKFGTFTFTIAAYNVSGGNKTYIDLNADNFNFLNYTGTGDGIFYAAVHIGNYDGPNKHPNTDSITVGATNAVPIPGAAWLFGSGLLGLVALKRKLKG